jgi:hypothetical protein
VIKINYWKFGAWFVVLVPVTSVLWWFAFEPAYYSQLAMPMRVHLDRPAGATPIKVVWLMSDFWRNPAWDRALADTEITKKWTTQGAFWTPESFNRDSFDFRVTGDDCGSTLGITLWYAQHKHLLVIAELVDGRRVGTIADIPDARDYTEMRVVLP